MVAGNLKRVDAIAKAMLHPFLSERLDDPLSVLLIRSSTSLAWNFVATGALLAAIILFLPGKSPAETSNSVFSNVLIGYSVIGIVWSALSALAHSSSLGRYGRGLLLFAIWPFSFVYNWRAAIRNRKSSGERNAT